MNRTPLLFLNVFIIATCGLIYELLAGTLASYVLGDSVTQFSLIIGIYLFAMGIGSWLSGFIEKHIAEKFIDIELAVAVLGGFSAPLLFLSFAKLSYFAIGFSFGSSLAASFSLSEISADKAFTELDNFPSDFSARFIFTELYARRKRFCAHCCAAL